MLHAAHSLSLVFSHLGEPATVLPLVGGGFDVVALRDSDPETLGFDGAARRRESVTFKVQVAGWPEPQRGDTVKIAGETRRVTDFEHIDALRLVWRIDTQVAAQ